MNVDQMRVTQIRNYIDLLQYMLRYSTLNLEEVVAFAIFSHERISELNISDEPVIIYWFKVVTPLMVRVQELHSESPRVLQLVEIHSRTSRYLEKPSQSTGAENEYTTRNHSRTLR